MTGWEPIFLKLVPLIPRWVSSGLTIAERRQLANVARDLAYLAFWNDGMLAPLRRIASGNDTSADIDDLAVKFAETEQGVSDAVARLNTAREDLVAGALGMSVARKLDDVVWQKI